MNTPQKQHKLQRTGIGTGSVSLLIIFTILSLTTLALLSLSTAVSAGRVSQRSISSVTNMAMAEGKIATELAGIDGILADTRENYHIGGDEADEHADTAYFTMAISALRAAGYTVDAETRTLTFSHSIDENSIFVCEILLLSPGEGQRYRVTSLLSQLVADWQPEPGGQLWSGS